MLGQIVKEIIVEGGKNVTKESAKDTARKIGLFGLGVWALTQEKLEEFSQELIKQGALNREEGKQFVIDVISEKNRQCQEIIDSINEKVKECTNEEIAQNELVTKKDINGLATKEDVNELKERLDKIDRIFHQK